MKRYVITAESGCDILPDVEEKYGIAIVPMHVNLGADTFPDRGVPIEQVFGHFEKTKQLPSTSGSMPKDFIKVFEEVEAKYPDDEITYIHLAYSSATTVSTESGFQAARERGMGNFHLFDTKSVTGAQGLIVENTARFIQENPEATWGEIEAFINEQIDRVRMCFLPGSLDYLRAGGRVSNSSYIAGTILKIKPLIEILDGRLIATKKIRGAMKKLVPQLTNSWVDDYNIDRRQIRVLYSAGLPQELRDEVEQILRDKGFEDIRFVTCGCVISCHCGPGAFGLAGIATE